MTGESMSFKDAYVTYLISRYPVIFYSLVEVGYALVKKQLISTDFSNYANILMVIFSQAIMYVYLDGRLSKKQNLIVKRAQTSDFNQGSSPLNYLIYFYHNSL